MNALQEERKEAELLWRDTQLAEQNRKKQMEQQRLAREAAERRILAQNPRLMKQKQQSVPITKSVQSVGLSSTPTSDNRTLTSKNVSEKKQKENVQKMAFEAAEARAKAAAKRGSSQPNLSVPKKPQIFLTSPNGQIKPTTKPPIFEREISESDMSGMHEYGIIRTRTSEPSPRAYRTAALFSSLEERKKDEFQRWPGKYSPTNNQPFSNERELENAQLFEQTREYPDRIQSAQVRRISSAYEPSSRSNERLFTREFVTEGFSSRSNSTPYKTGWQRVHIGIYFVLFFCRYFAKNREG